MSTLRITENKDEKTKSASNFATDDRPSTPVHEETCPFKVTLCFLSFKKSDKKTAWFPGNAKVIQFRILYQQITVK